MMKTMTGRVLAFVLATLLLLSAIGCQKPDDQQGSTNNGGNNQGTTVDPATDGVFNELDYNSKKDYQLPDYSQLTITDYIALGRYKNLTLTIADVVIK